MMKLELRDVIHDNIAATKFEGETNESARSSTRQERKIAREPSEEKASPLISEPRIASPENLLENVNKDTSDEFADDEQEIQTCMPGSNIGGKFKKISKLVTLVKPWLDSRPLKHRSIHRLLGEIVEDNNYRYTIIRGKKYALSKLTFEEVYITAQLFEAFEDAPRKLTSMLSQSDLASVGSRGKVTSPETEAKLELENGAASLIRSIVPDFANIRSYSNKKRVFNLAYYTLAYCEIFRRAFREGGMAQPLSSQFSLDDKMFDDNFVNIREEATPRAINILLVFMADCRQLPDMPFGYYFRSPDEEVRQNPKAKIVNAVFSQFLTSYNRLKLCLIKMKVNSSFGRISGFLERHVRTTEVAWNLLKTETFCYSPFYFDPDDKARNIHEFLKSKGFKNMEDAGSEDDQSSTSGGEGASIYSIRPSCPLFFDVPQGLDIGETQFSGVPIYKTNLALGLAASVVSEVLAEMTNNTQMILANTGNGKLAALISSMVKLKQLEDVFITGLNCHYMNTILQTLTDWKVSNSVKLRRQPLTRLSGKPSGKLGQVRLIFLNVDCSFSGVTDPGSLYLDNDTFCHEALRRVNLANTYDPGSVAEMAARSKTALMHCLTFFPKVDTIVYFTQSLFPQENEDVITSVLRDFESQYNANKDFKFEIKSYASQFPQLHFEKVKDEKQPFMTLSPQKEINGCFIAVIKRGKVTRTASEILAKALKMGLFTKSELGQNEASTESGDTNKDTPDLPKDKENVPCLVRRTHSNKSLKKKSSRGSVHGEKKKTTPSGDKKSVDSVVRTISIEERINALEKKHQETIKDQNLGDNQNHVPIKTESLESLVPEKEATKLRSRRSMKRLPSVKKPDKSSVSSRTSVAMRSRSFAKIRHKVETKVVTELREEKMESEVQKKLLKARTNASSQILPTEEKVAEARGLNTFNSSSVRPRSGNHEYTQTQLLLNNFRKRKLIYNSDVCSQRNFGSLDGSLLEGTANNTTSNYKCNHDGASKIARDPGGDPDSVSTNPTFISRTQKKQAQLGSSRSKTSRETLESLTSSHASEIGLKTRSRKKINKTRVYRKPSGRKLNGLTNSHREYNHLQNTHFCRKYSTGSLENEKTVWSHISTMGDNACMKRYPKATRDKYLLSHSSAGSSGSSTQTRMKLNSEPSDLEMASKQGNVPNKSGVSRSVENQQPVNIEAERPNYCSKSFQELSKARKSSRKSSNGDSKTNDSLRAKNPVFSLVPIKQFSSPPVSSKTKSSHSRSSNSKIRTYSGYRSARKSGFPEDKQNARQLTHVHCEQKLHPEDDLSIKSLKNFLKQTSQMKLETQLHYEHAVLSKKEKRQRTSSRVSSASANDANETDGTLRQASQKPDTSAHYSGPEDTTVGDRIAPDDEASIV